MQWKQVSDRLAEAAEDSIGIETPLRMDLAIKHFFIAMIAGFGALISGHALAMSVESIVAFYDNYDDETQNEARRDGQTTIDGFATYDSAGTSAENDYGYHIITQFYSFFVLAAISIGGYVFAYIYMNHDDVFECILPNRSDFDRSQYDGITEIIAAQTDRASCLATIQ